MNFAVSYRGYDFYKRLNTSIHFFKECILNGMVSIDTGFSAYLQHGTEDIVFQFFPL